MHSSNFDVKSDRFPCFNRWLVLVLGPDWYKTHELESCLRVLTPRTTLRGNPLLVYVANWLYGVDHSVVGGLVVLFGAIPQVRHPSRSTHLTYYVLSSLSAYHTCRTLRECDICCLREPFAPSHYSILSLDPLGALPLVTRVVFAMQPTWGATPRVLAD